MKSPVLDQVAILLHLPVGPECIQVDAVVEHSEEQTVVCRSFRASDPCFVGHFPNDPVVPGHVLVEASAQACGLTLGLLNQATQGTTLVLGSIDRFRIRQRLKPGDDLEMSVTRVKQLGSLYRFEVSGKVRDRTVFQGTLTMSGKSPD